MSNSIAPGSVVASLRKLDPNTVLIQVVFDCPITDWGSASVDNDRIAIHEPSPVCCSTDITFPYTRWRPRWKRYGGMAWPTWNVTRTVLVFHLLLPRSLCGKKKGSGEFAEILCEPHANAPWRDADDWMTPTRC